MNKPRVWKEEFKGFSAKRLFLIFVCLGLSFLGYIFLPVTAVHYQKIDVSQPGQNAAAVAASVGYAKQNEDPEEAIPCQGPKLTAQTSLWAGFRFQSWQALGILFLFLIPGTLATEISPYSNDRKAPFRVNFVIFTIFLVILIGLVLLFPPVKPACDPNIQYKLISFAPYWPSYVLVLVTYFAMRYLVGLWLGGSSWRLSKKVTSG